MQIRHFLSPSDLSEAELDRLLTLAGEIMANPDAYAHLCDR